MRPPGQALPLPVLLSLDEETMPPSVVERRCDLLVPGRQLLLAAHPLDLVMQQRPQCVTLDPRQLTGRSHARRAFTVCVDEGCRRPSRDRVERLLLCASSRSCARLMRPLWLTCSAFSRRPGIAPRRFAVALMLSVRVFVSFLRSFLTPRRV